MLCEIIEHKIGSWNAITLTDGEYTMTLLPEKGSDIISLRHEKTETEFLWTSPNGLTDTRHSREFLENYEGGWQECFPTGGPQILYHGALMPQHGEARMIAWRVIQKSSERNEVSVTLEARLKLTPFVLRKKITLRDRTGVFEFREEAVNEGEEDLPALWGHHPALGGNFFDHHCKIDAPAKKVCSYILPEHPITGQFAPLQSGAWPFLLNKKNELIDVSEIPRINARTADMLFISDFTDGWIAITNRERRVGLAFTFDPDFFTTVWFWQVYGGGFGYPWYGRAYTAALELFTGQPDPNAKNIDHVEGTQIICAHETLAATFKIILYKGLRGVGRITPEGIVVPRI